MEIEKNWRQKATQIHLIAHKISKIATKIQISMKSKID